MSGELTPHAAELPDQRDRYGLLAISIYLAFSLLIFGRTLLGHFRDSYIGIGPDPTISMWFFVFWPHALIHGLNLFFTDLVWAPKGINLAWTTSVPLLSFAGWPLQRASDRSRHSTFYAW